MTTHSGIHPQSGNACSKSLERVRRAILPKELEQLLDLLYGMFSHAYTLAEIRHIMMSDPFDRSETPRQFKLVDFTEWLESLVS